MKKIALIALGGLLLATAYSSLRWIPEGHLGVAGQGDQARVIPAGPGVKVPFAPSPDVYPLQLGPVSGLAPLRTSTGHLLQVGFTVTGRLDPHRAPDFHAKAAEHGVEKVMHQGAAHAIAAAASGLTPEGIVTGGLQDRAARSAAALLDQVGVQDVSLDLSLDSPETLLPLARALSPPGKAGLLREAAESAVARDDSDWRAHTALGLALESQRDLRGAESSYLSALALRPEALTPMARLVSLYTAVGEAAKLERILGAALSAAPESVQHLNWLAGNYMKRGLLDRAGEIYRQALELEAGNTVILNNLGGVYLKQNRLEEALGAFQQAVEASPRDRQSLYNLGVGLCSRGDHEDGLAYLLRANEVAPGRESILVAIARAQRELGRASEAAKWERLAGEASTESPRSASPEP